MKNSIRGVQKRMMTVSRSKRKTPIFGHTTAVSEKEDKTLWHRAFRRAMKQFLDDKNDIRHYSDPWGMSKDGKQYYKQATDEDMRK